MKIGVGIQEFLVTPLYIFFFLLLIIRLSKQIKERFTRKVFIYGFVLKMLGMLSFASIYLFYYGGGDTTNYYVYAQVIWQAFLDDPTKGFRILFTEAGSYEGDTLIYTTKIWYFRAAETWFITRLALVFSFFCFNSFFGVSLFFCLFSFFGLWRLYQAFVRIYPYLYKQFAVSVFLFPSALFWGSGLMKDTITLGALGFFTHYVFNIFYYRKNILISIFWMVLSSILIIKLKGYILLAFLPSLVLWVLANTQALIKNWAVKFLAFPFLIAFSVGIGFFFITTLQATTDKYDSIEEMNSRMAGFHNDHGQRLGGSAYTLGDLDYSPVGYLKKFPLAVNVTLFRPYLWEARSIVMLLSAIESLALLLITLYLFAKLGVINFIKYSFSNPEVLLCFSYSIILAFIVGLSAYNFGALARFKIPLLPFYGIGLSLVYYYTRGEAVKKKMQAAVASEAKLKTLQMAKL